MNDETNEEQPEQQETAEFVAELVDESPEPELVSEEVVPASIVTPTVAYDPSVLLPPVKRRENPPPSQIASLAAKGGAVGAIVLGALSFFGSFITSYAILNSLMGLMLGLWGLNSNHRRMATIGIVICLLSGFFCVVEISSWLQTLWPESEAF